MMSSQYVWLKMLNSRPPENFQDLQINFHSKVASGAHKQLLSFCSEITVKYNNNKIFWGSLTYNALDKHNIFLY